jgi:hypothetical protein
MRRDADLRQQSVAETRNILLSASQQLQNCQKYLSNIELPYCGAEEVATLEKAISYIFTDMQSKERHEHALSCYQTTHKRFVSPFNSRSVSLTPTLSLSLSLGMRFGTGRTH